MQEPLKLLKDKLRNVESDITAENDNIKHAYEAIELSKNRIDKHMSTAKDLKTAIGYIEEKL